MPKSLVIGSGGLVGSHLLRELQQANGPQTVIGANHQALDICDETATRNYIVKHTPKIIYLAAANSNVDYCEKNPTETREINIRGAINVANIAQDIHAKLVYFSSDYIFDGRKGPYVTGTIANPINEYGKQKFTVEHRLLSQVSKLLIVRTAAVFGAEPAAKNFGCRVVRTLRNGYYVLAATDQYSTPTYAGTLAKIAVCEANKDTAGVTHVSGLAHISRYDFASAVAKQFGLHQDLVRAVKTHELKQPAKRPQYAGLLGTVYTSSLEADLTTFAQEFEFSWKQ